MVVYFETNGYTSTEEALAALAARGITPAGLTTAQQLAREGVPELPKYEVEFVFLDPKSYRHEKQDEGIGWTCCPVLYPLAREVRQMSVHRTWWKAVFVGIKE